MKKQKNNHLSISDLTQEFDVSKKIIERYGAHRLLTPMPRKSDSYSYSPFDRIRLQFITRANLANYSLSDIKELIGLLDQNKSMEDQIEAGLAHSKRKFSQQQDNLKNQDVLEQINISCDLRLLEPYIKSLTNLKYNLNDLNYPNVSISIEKLESIPFESDFDAAEATPFKEGPPVWKTIIVIAGIFVLLVFGYLYINNFANPKKFKESAELRETDVVDRNPSIIGSKEADQDHAIQSVNIEPNNIELGQPNNGSSKLDLSSQADNSTPHNYLDGQNTESGGLKVDKTVDEQTDTTLITAGLLDALKESEQTEQNTKLSENEKNENEFFHLLVSDLKKKYDEKAQIPPLKPVRKGQDNPTSKKEVKPTHKNKTATGLTASATVKARNSGIEKFQNTPKANLTANDKSLQKPKTKPKSSTKKATQKVLKKLVSTDPIKKTISKDRLSYIKKRAL